MNSLSFVGDAALVAVLFGLLLFHRQPGRRPFSVGESVLRAVCALVLAWICLAATTTWAWCQPRDFFSCLSTTLEISGIFGGPTVLLLAVLVGLIVGVRGAQR